MSGAANATSNAETTKGALAQAQSTAVGASGEAQSTAKASFAGVSVQSTAVAPTGGTATTNAIAQGGGSGQAFVNPGQTAYAFSTALPDKAYAVTLIDGATNVADALLGPRDKVFGTAILGTQGFGDSAEFDVRFPLSGRSASWLDRWFRRIFCRSQRRRKFSPRVSSMTASSIWVPTCPTSV